MVQRIPIPTDTRKEVLQRDDRTCQKCGSQIGVNLHHKQQVVFDGTNDADNLISLCTMCHREWHTLFSGQPIITFDQWLTAPPAFMLVAGWVNDFPEGTLLADWRTQIQSFWRLNVQMMNEASSK